jgi:hypothetical protein
MSSCRATNANVCSSCDEEPAREGHGIERSYEPTGGLLSPNESTAGVRRALGENYEKIMALDEQIVCVPAADAYTLVRQASKAEVVRLKRMDSGGTVQSERAKARARIKNRL